MRERRQADGAAYHGVLGAQQQHRAALLPCTLEVVAAPTAERQQRTCWYADSPHAQQRSGAIGLHRRIAFISPVHTPDRKPQISRLRRMRPVSVWHGRNSKRWDREPVTKFFPGRR
jgi:hypothetical protein